MTQDVVTATAVAVPVDASVKLPDVQLISERIDQALVAGGFEPAEYAPSVKYLFQQAWALATHKQNTQVSIYHLAFALAFSQPEAGEALATHLQADVEAFAIGCILRLLSRGVPRTDRGILSPAVATVRWIGAAGALARLRGGTAELLPDDLVRAVLDDRLANTDRNELRLAARIGKFRHDTVLGHRPVPLIANPGAAPADIIQRVQEFEKGESAAGLGSADVAGLLSRLDDLFEHQNGVIAEHSEMLEHIEALIRDRLVPVAQPVTPNEDILSKLAAIDQRVEEVHNALPKPPSALRLAAALIAVVALGVGAGLTLSLYGPDIAQAIVTRVAAALDGLAH